jgi:UDP-glucose 4-epimerase
MADRRSGDAEQCLAIPGKANDVLEWKTQYNIEDMCRDTWNWARQNQNGYE